MDILILLIIFILLFKNYNFAFAQIYLLASSIIYIIKNHIKVFKKGCRGDYSFQETMVFPVTIPGKTDRAEDIAISS